MLMSPIIVPTIILAVALYYLFASYGLIGTRTGLILAHTVLAVPYVIVVVSAALERIDLSLEQAAWTLGATKFKAFVKVTLPLIRPAVLIASLFAFLAYFLGSIVPLAEVLAEHGEDARTDRWRDDNPWPLDRNGR